METDEPSLRGIAEQLNLIQQTLAALTQLPAQVYGGSQGKKQNEGQEDQGTLNQLGGSPQALVPLPGPPGIPSFLPSGSSLGSLQIHQTSLSNSLS